MRLPLSILYLSHARLATVVRSFLDACPDFCLLSKQREQQIIDAIANGDETVSRDLFEAYSNNLRKAINTVFADGNTPLADSLRANASRFSAYKAALATAQIRDTAKNNGDPLPVLHKFNRYQATEYSTAIGRARTGKQFEEFNDDMHRRLFPNIRWLPSVAAVPREEHRIFWNRVWPKDDPFWNENQPHNLWNCMCDWEETDDDVTTGNPLPRVVEAHQGLEGNPAETGEVFTDRHPYIKNAQEPREIETCANRIERAKYQNDDNLKAQLMAEHSVCIDGDGSIAHVDMNKYGYHEVFGKMVSASFEECYYKNEIAKRWSHYLSNSKWVARAENNMEHNSSGGKRNEWKQHCDYFDYYKVTLPRNRVYYMSVAHHRNGKCFLWAITTVLPSY